MSARILTSNHTQLRRDYSVEPALQRQCFKKSTVTSGWIQEFLIGGPNFGPERTVSLFCDQLRKQRRLRVSQSVSAGRRWCGKYCFASRDEQIIGGYPKTITFLNIPMQSAFHKKNQPVKK